MHWSLNILSICSNKKHPTKNTRKEYCAIPWQARVFLIGEQGSFKRNGITFGDH